MKLLLFITLSTISLLTSAQFSPNIVQFPQTMLLYNPAYAGLNSQAEVSGSYAKYAPNKYALPIFKKQQSPTSGGIAIATPIVINKTKLKSINGYIGAAYLNDWHFTNDFYFLGANLKMQYSPNLLISGGLEIRVMDISLQFREADSMNEAKYYTQHTTPTLGVGFLLQNENWHHGFVGFSANNLFAKYGFEKHKIVKGFFNIPLNIYISGGLILDSFLHQNKLAFSPSFLYSASIFDNSILNNELNLSAAITFIKFFSIIPQIILNQGGSYTPYIGGDLYPLAFFKSKKLPVIRLGYAHQYAPPQSRRIYYGHHFTFNLTYKLGQK